MSLNSNDRLAGLAAIGLALGTTGALSPYEGETVGSWNQPGDMAITGAKTVGENTEAFLTSSRAGSTGVDIYKLTLDTNGNALSVAKVTGADGPGDQQYGTECSVDGSKFCMVDQGVAVRCDYNGSTNTVDKPSCVPFGDGIDSGTYVINPVYIPKTDRIFVIADAVSGQRHVWNSPTPESNLANPGHYAWVQAPDCEIGQMFSIAASEDGGTFMGSTDSFAALPGHGIVDIGMADFDGQFCTSTWASVNTSFPFNTPGIENNPSATKKFFIGSKAAGNVLLKTPPQGGGGAGGVGGSMGGAGGSTNTMSTTTTDTGTTTTTTTDTGTTTTTTTTTSSETMTNICANGAECLADCTKSDNINASGAVVITKCRKDGSYEATISGPDAFISANGKDVESNSFLRPDTLVYDAKTQDIFVGGGSRISYGVTVNESPNDPNKAIIHIVGDIIALEDTKVSISFPGVDVDSQKFINPGIPETVDIVALTSHVGTMRLYETGCDSTDLTSCTPNQSFDTGKGLGSITAPNTVFQKIGTDITAVNDVNPLLKHGTDNQPDREYNQDAPDDSLSVFGCNLPGNVNGQQNETTTSLAALLLAAGIVIERRRRR